jgi:hypothetical protein
MGNRMADGKTVSRMAQLMNSAPQLETARKEQIAALPLGGRVKVDPWSCRVMMLRNKPVALLSAREKLSFEVTPFLPYLTRQSTTEQVAAAGAVGAVANTGAATGNGGGATDQFKTSGSDHDSQGSTETTMAATEARPATPAAPPKQ